LKAGDARVIRWTNNNVLFDEVDGVGQPVKTPFFNFTAGIYMHAHDAWRTTDSYSGPSTGPFKRFNALFTLNNGNTDETDQHLIKNYCGTTATYANGLVKVFVQKRTATRNPNNSWTYGSWTQTTCPDVTDFVATDYLGSNKSNTFWPSTTDRTEQYNFYSMRIRNKYSYDTYAFTTMKQTERTISWDQMVLKEKVGSLNLCSAHQGYWPSRQVYVSMLDANGRQIQERREVFADFPGDFDLGNLAYSINGDLSFNGSAYGDPDGIRYKDVSRPNMTTDATYLTLSPLVDDYIAVNSGVSPWSSKAIDIASKGLISQSMRLTDTKTCELVARP